VWDRLKLRLPIFGKLIHKIVISRFSCTFAALLRSGVPILETLRIVGQSSGNTLVEQAVEQTAAGIERGDNLASALGQHKIFPPLLIVSLGVVVGSIVVCMFLPIFKLNQIVQF